ncbi:hypothetical protein JCM10908_001970 [Rhodotorula pacifica]|uniref:J domain-containing protein n=1 Tax=Rhodotorula pacifica TaxID=1495444 RepID=UPI003172BB70
MNAALVPAHSASLYSLLELAPSASLSQIRAAYLRLAKVWHPDRVPAEQREKATSRFQALAKAYMTLSDETRRRVYDLSLRLPAATPSSSLSPAYNPAFSSEASGPLYHHDYTAFQAGPAALESPFPGYRVPPGGYPRQVLPRPSCGTSAVSEEAHSTYNRDAAPQPRSDFLPADPFALAQQQIFAEMHDLALHKTEYPDLYHRPPHHHHNNYHKHHGAGGPEERCKTARKEWSEAKTESNGDRVTKAGRHEVTYCQDGTTKWRSESTTIISHGHSHPGHHYRPKHHLTMPGGYPGYPPPHAHRPPHHHHHYNDRPHQSHGHRSRSLPPLEAPHKPLPLPPPPPHIPLRSPGGYVPGPSPYYEGYYGDLRHRHSGAGHGYQKRIEPAHEYYSPLFGAPPGWKDRERELVH